jgi:hypothetical protein
MKIKTNLIIDKNNTVDYSELTEIVGSVYVREGATFNAPLLTKCGYVYVRKGATFNAPLLKL